ncbi:MAG: DNA repair exonuclease [Bacteroidales bacterium]|nr:DNA repair exonuclease [Bacteroidales bacterium]
MALKLLATGDLHLGKRSSGVPGNPDDASAKYSWDRLVNYVLDHQVDALLLLGDIVDRDNRYFEAVGAMIRGLEQLESKGVEVLMVSGNHDFDLPAQLVRSRDFTNVKLLGANGQWEVYDYKKGKDSLRFIGWSFPGQTVTFNPLNTFPLQSAKKDLPVIGLLHCDVDVRESRYAPVVLDDFIRTGADAWVLGHIHKPGPLRPQGPVVWYTGSPHALNAKEQGVHGPLLLTVQGKNALKAETIPLSPVRYENLSLDLTACKDAGDVKAMIPRAMLEDAGAKLNELTYVNHLVYDLTLEGVQKSTGEVLETASSTVKDLALTLDGRINISVRKLVNNLKPAIEDLKTLSRENSPAGKLAESILALQQNKTTPFLDELSEQWTEAMQKMHNSGTFLPLKSFETEREAITYSAREFLLKECNRLLNELIAQRTP